MCSEEKDLDTHNQKKEKLTSTVLQGGKSKIKDHKDYIIKKLSQKYGNIECVETEYSGHAHDIAKDAIGKYDYFL